MIGGVGAVVSFLLESHSFTGYRVNSPIPTFPLLTPDEYTLAMAHSCTFGRCPMNTHIYTCFHGRRKSGVGGDHALSTEN